MENGSYFKVVCTETKNNKVIYDEEVAPGDTVNIHGVAVGNYEISVELFQPDRWSMFENSIVKTSSATAECTVKGGESYDGKYVTYLESDDVDFMNILNGNSPFDIQIQYGDEDHTLPVTQGFLNLLNEESTVKVIEQPEFSIRASKNSFDFSIGRGKDFIITNVYPYKVYCMIEAYTESGYDAKSYYFDYFTVGNNSHQYSEKLMFILEEDGNGKDYNMECIGTTFQTFEELQNALSGVFEKQTTLNMFRNGKKMEIPVMQAVALNINRWLKGESVVDNPTDDEPQGGAGTDPSFAGYVPIHDYNELKEYASSGFSGNYYLADDITVDSVWDYNLNLNGIFDGNGHTITFEKQDEDSGCNYFISQINENAVVRNLNLAGELCFYASISNFAPFGTNNGYIIACSIAGVSMSEKFSNPLNKYTMCTSGSGCVVGCIIDGNKQGLDEENYICCYNKDVTAPVDLDVLNGGIGDYNSTQDNPDYRCNYHFDDSGSGIVLIKK